MTTKQQLNAYLNAMQAVRRAGERLEEARARAESMTVSASGMPPGGPNPSKLAATVEAVEEAEDRLHRLLFAAGQQKKTVQRLIGRVHGREWVVLTTRYIEAVDKLGIDYTPEAAMALVEAALKVSRSTAYLVHNRALARLEREKAPGSN